MLVQESTWLLPYKAFIIAMIVQMLDPVLMIGPVGAGFMAKVWWRALGAGAGWVLLVKLVIVAVTTGRPQSPHADLIFGAGICMGAFVAGIIWLIRDQVRKSKERT